MSILRILDEIAATSSTNAKEAILLREKNNLVLKSVFAATYNKLISYHIKKIPVIKKHDGTSSLSLAVNRLQNFSSRAYTGNAAIEYLGVLLVSLDEEDAVVLSRIIDRDLRCGCSDSIASRVWPGLVPVFDVMLCDKDMSRIKYPAYINLKCDGARVHLFWDGANVKAMSRAGKEFQLLGALDEAAKLVMKPGECWDGELIVIKDGKVASRQVGNGIMTKANKGTISQEEADSIVAVCWDIVDFSSTLPYHKRFSDMLDRPINLKIKIVPWKIVNTEDEAMEFFAEQRRAGEEGAVVKNAESLWVPKRSKDLVKLKAIESADLIVVDTFEGTGKYKGMLGGLICQTSDGLLEVRVGSGFSDEQRADTTSWMSSIVEVLYNAKIQSKGKDKACLFLPRFVVKRFDKTVANTLDELK